MVGALCDLNMHKKRKLLASFHLGRSHTACCWWLTETVVGSNCLFIGHSVDRRGAKLKKTFAQRVDVVQFEHDSLTRLIWNIGLQNCALKSVD
ncbi:hypothetical protein T05_1556 [Trichinella murrelli]|uniref:Uncharacterized protein n=1 Tax=Trichinella murrelli TaxID=144512 RepID=A0A0V0TC07_9BILA|nr:hypothetical protein T05_1556 [Trichinella murrelli]